MSDNTTHDHHPRTGNSRKNPQRQIRLPDELYYPAVEKARSEGTTLARVLERLLADYLAADA